MSLHRALAPNIPSTSASQSAMRSGISRMSNRRQSVASSVANMETCRWGTSLFYNSTQCCFLKGVINRAFTKNLTIVDDEPYMYMMDGSPCPGAASSNLRASTAIRFICDSSIFSSGSPKLVAQLPPKDFESCAYFIEWRTPVSLLLHSHIPCTEPPSISARLR